MNTLTVPTWKEFRKEWRRLKLWNTSESAKEAELIWKKLPDWKKVLAHKYAARFQTDFRKNYSPETTMLHCCRYLSPRKEPFMNYEEEDEPETAPEQIKIYPGTPEGEAWMNYEIEHVNKFAKSHWIAAQFMYRPSQWPPEGAE